MRRLVSYLLLLASAAVFAGGAGLTVALLAMRDAALWMGGWGLLLIGQPVVTIGLLFLVFGLAMRWLSDEGEELRPERAKLPYRGAAWALIALGFVVVADHSVKTGLFALSSQVELGIFAFLPILGPQLPLGLAAMFLGLIVLRRAPRDETQAGAAADPALQGT